MFIYNRWGAWTFGKWIYGFGPSPSSLNVGPSGRSPAFLSGRGLGHHGLVLGQEQGGVHTTPSDLVTFSKREEEQKVFDQNSPCCCAASEVDGTQVLNRKKKSKR